MKLESSHVPSNLRPLQHVVRRQLLALYPRTYLFDITRCSRRPKKELSQRACWIHSFEEAQTSCRSTRKY